MLNNVMIIGILVGLFWIGSFIFYMYISRQQEKLGDEINELKNELDQNPLP